MINPKNKEKRYQRLYNQIEKLMDTCGNESSRRASIIALLSHKIDYFFWTGYYLLNNGELLVDHYQGPWPA